MGIGPGAGDAQGARTAGLTLGRHGRHRAERGVRRAGAGGDCASSASPTTPRTSIRTAARSRSAIRWARAGARLVDDRALAARSDAADATRSARCASASARGSPRSSSACSGQFIVGWRSSRSACSQSSRSRPWPPPRATKILERAGGDRFVVDGLDCGACCRPLRGRFPPIGFRSCFCLGHRSIPLSNHAGGSVIAMRADGARSPIPLAGSSRHSQSSDQPETELRSVLHERGPAERA